MTSDPPIVSNVRRGDGATVCVCDVLIGSIKISGVTLRIGRNQSSHINLPRTWQAGRWHQAVEVMDRALLDAIHTVVIIAAVAVNRPGGV